jgi:ATPase
MIPSVVDTVIFIENGKIGQIYEMQMSVKVPDGMKEADLARPVIEVKDFIKKDIVFEIYTYGEQTCVMPVKPKSKYINPYKRR